MLDHDPGGPDAHVKYGRHFLFQGHENAGNNAYLTRINLDVTDPAHRITLLTAPDAVSGKTGLNSIDGSSWDPFTETLLLTQEAGTNGGVIELPVRWLGTTPPAMRKLDCVIGKGGYEGIHPDDKGNLFLAEDSGGTGVSIDPANINGTTKVAKQPNSFIYRFEPNNRYDLSQGGQLYALQVSVGSPLTPLVFGGSTAAAAFADVYSPAQKDLRKPGSNWPAIWVRVHDTGGAPDPATCSAFDANARPRPRTPLLSSGPRISSSSPARTSTRSSSTRPVTRTCGQARCRTSRTAERGARFFASGSHGTAPTATSASSWWAT